MNNFWEQLKKPLFVLAPMADVTDVAFRSMFAKYGKPDVTWTEFVSCDGLYATREREKMKDEENPLMQDLLYTDEERPIVAQLFSSNPEMMEYGAKLVKELGYDGVDINMGCPDRSIEKQGAGSAHMKDPENAKRVILAARKAGIPVSVKTRIGYNKEEIDTWIKGLLELELPVLTVHLRTRKEMSKVAAHWDLMPRIVALRDEISPSTLIIGNGDVESKEDGEEKIKMYGCDGVMVGRGIFGNPWFFNTDVKEVSKKEKLEVMLEHTRLYEKLLPHKAFHIMKKHYKAYVSGFDGAAELRAKLFQANNADEVEEILREESHI
ncbi:MAG: tRNA dihydrouridine synthase [Patescibacteria group bacterium UBA2103]